jgi:CRISPR-associated protein Cas1
MIKRTLYFGNPAYLHKNLMQLKVIKPDDNSELGSVPIEDIGAVLLDHPQITITHALMAACSNVTWPLSAATKNTCLLV